MHLDPNELLLTAGAAVLTLQVAAWGWLLRRWVIRSDALHREVETLRTQAAVGQERMANLAGTVETLRRTVSDQAETVAVLSAAVEKLWIVLQAKGLIEPRQSDEALRTSRRKP